MVRARRHADFIWVTQTSGVTHMLRTLVIGLLALPLTLTIASCTGAPPHWTNVNGEFKPMGPLEEGALLRSWHGSSVSSLKISRISNPYKRLILVNLAQAYESSLKTKAECFPLKVSDLRILDIASPPSSSATAKPLPLQHSENWYVRACEQIDEWHVFVDAEGPKAMLVRPAPSQPRK
jgi:hypothetical protein